MRSGAEILIAELRRNGTQRIFTVPGESFLSALDALHEVPDIALVTCRQEGGAAMMAEATARLAGPLQPAAGVVFVSRGPGLANAMSGLHVAMQGATPLLVLVGLGRQTHQGRGGFQEVEIARLAGAFAKHVEIVGAPERIPEVMQRALTIAHAGRPGPVIVGVPEDVLGASSDVADAAPVQPVAPAPDFARLMELGDMILAAEWPVIIAGGRWSATASRQLQAFAERLDLPLVASFRSQDVIDNRSPAYCGHAGLAPAPKLKAALASADLIIALGTHLDEVTTAGFETLAVPTPRQRLVHVHADAASLGRNHATALAILAGPEQLAARLEDIAASIRPGMAQRWSILRRDMRTAFEASQRLPAPHSSRLVEEAGGEVRAVDAGARVRSLSLDAVVQHLCDALPEDAIITNGAGNYAAVLHRHFTYKAPLTQLAPVSGSMGYGLPAAIAAKLAHPDRAVVCLAGDGCFQMTGQELATAVQYGVAVTIIVADNAMFGTIRAAQERTYPGRVIGSSLVNPDFAALAGAHGAGGVRAETLADFKAALEAARDAAVPTLIALALTATPTP